MTGPESIDLGAPAPKSRRSGRAHRGDSSTNGQGDSVNSGNFALGDTPTKLVPLKQQFDHVPFPIDALPDWLADMVESVAETMQVDPAMPGVVALTVLATAAGRAVEIEPQPGWVEPLNLFAAIAAPPGERKSGVQQELIKPIKFAQAQLAEDSTEAYHRAKKRKQIAEGIAKAAEKEAIKDSDPTSAKKAEDTEIAAAMIAVPPIVKLLADDITPEALGVRLAEQQRLAVISAEGGIFDIMAGRYSNNLPNLDPWLKGHAGDSFQVDRIGRPPIDAERPALTVGLMIQPAVLDAIGQHVQFRGRGLLDRFLYAFPESKVGWRNLQPLAQDVRHSYSGSVVNLIMGLAPFVDRTVVITLTPAASAAFLKIRETTERGLRPGGDLAELKQWGSKYDGAVIRLAGLLHMAEHGAKGIDLAVGPETIEKAARLGEYFKLQARQAFAEMGSDQLTADSIYVVRKIFDLAARMGYRDGEIEIADRDCYRASQGRFKTKKDIEPVIENLIYHGYLIKLPQPKQTGAGRPPSPRYRVHPDAREHVR